jgi:hypothetical protein
MRLLARIGAGILGAIALLVFTVFTIGTALIAVLAVGAVYAIRRRRGRPLTYLQSWITATLAACVVVFAAGAIVMTRTSPDGKTYWQSFDQSIQQARAHPAPLPAFLRNLPRAQPVPLPKSVEGAFTFVGLVLGVEMVGAVIGSLAWSAGWLLVFAWTGKD